MLEFITRDNITLLIATAGFSLSLYNSIRSWFEGLNRINLIYKEHTAITREKSFATFYLIFENKSKLPLSVSRLVLTINNNSFEFSFLPEQIWEFKTTIGGETIDRRTILSEQLPFEISGLGCKGGYFRAVINKEAATVLKEPTQILFSVYTNRGIKKFLVPVNKSGYSI